MAALNQNVDADFVHFMQAGLTYWLNEIDKIEDIHLEQLDKDIDNLRRLLMFGLSHANTLEVASELCLKLFEYAFYKGIWGEWVEFLESAAERVSQTNKNLYARLLQKLGFLQFHINNSKEAEKLLHEAIALAEEEHNKSLLASIYITFTQLYFMSGELDKAEKLGLEAIRLFSETECSDYQQALAYKTLGNVYHFKNSLIKSIRYFTNALELAQVSSHQLLKSQILLDLAYVYIKDKQFGRANQCFEQTLTILEQTNFEITKAVVHINRGLLYYEQKNYEEAEKEYLQANSNALRQSSHYEYRAIVTNNLGQTYLDTGDYERARQFLEESISLKRKANNQLSLALTLSTYVDVLLLFDELDVAQEVLNEALIIVKAYPNDEDAKKLQIELSKQRSSIEERKKTDPF